MTPDDEYMAACRDLARKAIKLSGVRGARFMGRGTDLSTACIRHFPKKTDPRRIVVLDGTLYTCDNAEVWVWAHNNDSEYLAEQLQKEVADYENFCIERVLRFQMFHEDPRMPVVDIERLVDARVAELGVHRRGYWLQGPNGLEYMAPA